MSTITLTLTTTSVTLADGRGTLTASVTNGAPVPAKVVLGAFGPAGGGAGASASGWTTIDRPIRDVAAGATEQFAVTIAAPSPATPGSFPVRFIAYSADQAPEEHADQAKQVDVVVPAAPAVVPPPPKKWWPWAIAAALVLVVGVVAFLLMRPGGGTVATPSPTPTATTPTPTITPTVGPTTPANPCKPPYVPRLTRPSDLRCVTAASAAEVVFDNNPAIQGQRRAGGGIYGPDTCKQGWVWRDAYDGDHVCVTGATRDRTAAENKPAYIDGTFDRQFYPTAFFPRLTTP